MGTRLRFLVDLMLYFREPSLTRFLEKLSATDMYVLELMHEKSPFSEEFRDDLRTGHIVSAVYNANPMRKSGKQVHPMDAMPSFEKMPKPRQTREQQIAIVKGFAAMLGATHKAREQCRQQSDE